MPGFIPTAAPAIALALAAALSPAHAFRVDKGEFSRFVGVLACGASSEFCSGAEQGFVQHGLAGEGDLSDPSAPELTRGGNIVVGFLEGKPFSWARYSVDYPGS